MKTVKLFLLTLILAGTSVLSSKAQGVKYMKDDTLSFIFKSNLFYYITGTAHLGVEVPFRNNRNSIYFALMGSDYTKTGNTNKEQYFGPGLELQYRSYLGKNSGPTKYPFYYGIHLMGRHLEKYTKHDDSYVWDYNTNTNVFTSGYETNTTMNVYYGGIVLGYQQIIGHAISLDFYIGGGLRLTYYGGENSPTRYKSINDFDYSGILPKSGIIIGILNR